MKKIFSAITIATIVFAFLPQGVFSAQYNAIIYVDRRSPAVSGDLREHWKPQLPDVGAGELIRDFKILEHRGEKFVVHALVETSDGQDGQFGRIKNHIRVINGCTAPDLKGATCSTPVADQILIWWAKNAEIAYTRLWQDRSNHFVFETIAKSVLRYPVETTCDGSPCTLIVSVADAENIYSEVIDPQKIMVPHRFYGK